jgi:hypothetical protein
MSRRHPAKRSGRYRTALRKKVKKGFQGYPIATIAWYGPTDQLASKVAVGIVPEEDGEVAYLERWFSEDEDVRRDPEISREIIDFIGKHRVRSVVMTEGIIGCPHEEGIDYPEGEECPECPFWAGRDWWSGARIAEDGRLDEEVVMGVGWYKPEQWERLREVSEDGEEMAETYEEWKESAERGLGEMRKAGLNPERVEVDVEELVAWCEEQKRPLDASARVEYVALEAGRRRKSGGGA